MGLGAACHGNIGQSMAYTPPTTTSAFTTPTAANFLTVELWEELRLADSERTNFMPNDGAFWIYSEATAGTDVYEWDDNGNGESTDSMMNHIPTQGFSGQEYLFFDGLQYDVEYTFIDNRYCYPTPADYSGDDIHDGSDWLLNFQSFLDFCRYCGGSMWDSDTVGEYGFRKCVEMDSSGQPIFTRGNIEEGDILGYWLAEDLILCYENLTHCYYESKPTNTAAFRLDESGISGDTDAIITQTYKAVDPDLVINGKTVLINDGAGSEWYVDVYDYNNDYDTRYTIDRDLNIYETVNGGTKTLKFANQASLTITITVPDITINSAMTNGTLMPHLSR